MKLHSKIFFILFLSFTLMTPVKTLANPVVVLIGAIADVKSLLEEKESEYLNLQDIEFKANLKGLILTLEEASSYDNKINKNFVYRNSLRDINKSLEKLAGLTKYFIKKKDFDKARSLIKFYETIYFLKFLVYLELDEKILAKKAKIAAQEDVKFFGDYLSCKKETKSFFSFFKGEKCESIINRKLIRLVTEMKNKASALKLHGICKHQIDQAIITIKNGASSSNTDRKISFYLSYLRIFNVSIFKSTNCLTYLNKTSSNELDIAISYLNFYNIFRKLTDGVILFTNVFDRNKVKDLHLSLEEFDTELYKGLAKTILENNVIIFQKFGAKLEENKLSPKEGLITINEILEALQKLMDLYFQEGKAELLPEFFVEIYQAISMVKIGFHIDLGERKLAHEQKKIMDKYINVFNESVPVKMRISEFCKNPDMKSADIAKFKKLICNTE